MSNRMKDDHLEEVKAELRFVRQKSLAASRDNDYRTVARLTAEAARLNRIIDEEETFAGFSPKSLAVVDALSIVGDAGRFVFPDEESIRGDGVDDREVCAEAA